MNVEKVLVADDSAAMRKSIAKALEKQGFEVVQAQDGLEAFELYRREKPSLVTLDIHMPNVDGIEALERIIKLNPAARVVMISSEGRKRVQAECQRKGAKFFFLKQELGDMNILADLLKRISKDKPVPLAHKKIRRLVADEAEAVETAVMEILDKFDLDPRPVQEPMPEKSHYTVTHGFRGRLMGDIHYMTTLETGLSMVKHIQAGVILEDVFNEISGLISLNYESMGVDLDRVSERKTHIRPSTLDGRFYQFKTPFGVLAVCNCLA